MLLYPQALEHLSVLEDIADVADSQDSIHLRIADFLAHPKYELNTSRKFEVSELCVIFFNKYVSYAYTIILCLYGFLLNWGSATIAGSAIAISIPFHIGSAEMCADEAFLHRTIPAGGCLYAYYISLTILAIVVVPVALFDIKEQSAVQVIVGILRFLTLTLIIIYCIVRLVGGGDACWDELELTNTSTPVNVEMTAMVWRFDFRSWLVAIPVIVSAFLYHSGISSLTHHIEEKLSHHWLLVSVFMVSVVCYLGVGVVVPLWFRLATQEICTLSWVSFLIINITLPGFEDKAYQCVLLSGPGVFRLIT